MVRSLVIFLFFTLLFWPQILRADASYWGGTGLLQIPNGRIIGDGDLRISISQNYPYRTFSSTFGFLPFLELNGRLTEVLDAEITSPGWEGYGNYKDKSADIKLQLLQEHNWWPSLAVGSEDIHGTKLFHSKYITMSRKFGPVDMTLGYGDDRLDGLFGGIEWEIRPNFSLLFEYDPTETLAPSNKKIDSHRNWGARWKPWQWLNLGYSFQRGEEHSFCLTFNFPFGKQILPQKPDYPFVGPVDHTSLLTSGIHSRLSRIKDYLVDEGFSDVKVVLSDNLSELYIEYQNDKYLSQVKALGRVLRVVVAQIPSDIKRVHAIAKSREIPMIRISLNPKDFIDMLNGKISKEEMKQRTEITTNIPVYGPPDFDKDIASIEGNPVSFSYKFKPIAIETYLNDPSGFFRARVGPQFQMEKELSKGLALSTNLRFPVYTNVSTSTLPISTEPIRSDIVDYLDDTGVCVENLVLDNIFRIGDNSFGRRSLGYLELQFAGASAEYLRTFKDGRFGLGTEITWAKKRSSNSVFGLEDFNSATPFLKGYLFVPEFDLTLQARAGQFLAGDKGVRFEITRYVRGASVFFWYTKTDTSDFTGPNRDYSEKGVGFTIPVRIFQNYDCRGSYSYAMSAWSRDVGQIAEQPYSLFGFIREFLPAQIGSHWQEITD